jgi:hypothetical protein
MARADLIDFETQGVGAGSYFTSSLNSPLVIDFATFSGGRLLLDETFSVDETAVYGTADFAGGAYTDPLTILFATPVSGFSVQVTNEIPGVYTVADNLGGSQSAALGLNDPYVFDLSDTGITSVTIGGVSAPYWDFAIDNVQFAPAVFAQFAPGALPPGLDPVPEPKGVLPLASMLGFTTLLARSARRKGLTQL